MILNQCGRFLCGFRDATVTGGMVLKKQLTGGAIRPMLQRTAENIEHILIVVATSGLLFHRLWNL